MLVVKVHFQPPNKKSICAVTKNATTSHAEQKARQRQKPYFSIGPLFSQSLIKFTSGVHCTSERKD